MRSCNHLWAFLTIDQSIFPCYDRQSLSDVLAILQYTILYSYFLFFDYFASGNAIRIQNPASAFSGDVTSRSSSVVDLQFKGACSNMAAAKPNCLIVCSSSTEGKL